MQRYNPIDVSESELEDLVRQAPDLIEKGLRFVDHQTFTSRGRLDVLLVDSGNALCVTELKVSEDDGMLVQGLDYYDYVSTNLDGFARAYGQHKIDPTQMPRLFLIAPSFSVTLLNRIKWIDIPVSLFTLQCIELEDAKGQALPVYKEITAPGAPEQVEAYSIDERYDYITNPDVRRLAKELVAEIEGWDTKRVLAEAIKNDISIKVSGRVLAYLAPRRQFFLVYTDDADGVWTWLRVDGDSDIEDVKVVLKANFVKM